MNPTQTFHAAVLMLAWSRGHPIQFRLRGATSWKDLISPHRCEWDFLNYEYRAHPDHPILP